MMFAASALTKLMVTSLYQQQANTQTVRSIQNQTSSHSQSSICINDVCTKELVQTIVVKHPLDA
ncbi:MAG TPA: hypothetical protein VFY41_07025 [Nitrososphaeraceae archaeon]|nr:hypothetical protein [Nitrososphaeraceae archaeon]